MKIKYMTRNAINDLKTNFTTYKKYYQSSDIEWMKNYIEKNNALQTSKIECEDFNLNMDEDYAISDMKNIIILYSALKNLSISDAADERLWSGLAHGQLWEYVQYRRKEEIKSNDDMKIKASYFYIRGTKRSSHIHCIARLWWAGHLTYDENREDPFELTRVLCEKAFASNLMLFSSSNFTANKELTIGILSSLKKWRDSGHELKRQHFVEATKYLNSMGSMTILDFLDRNNVEKIIDNLLLEKF